MRATLHRLEQGEEGTFGQLAAGPLRLFSLELPWRSNAPSISCIPPGAYGCILTLSPRFKRPLYLVGPVRGRSGIRVHPANLSSQLNGCIALGEKLGQLGGKKAVLLSAPAVRKLEEFFGGQSFALDVRDPM